MQVIYADILFIINLYITYALLLLTAFITKTSFKRVQFLISSALSGLYSMIILTPHISEIIISISRIPAMVIILLIAFKCKDKRHLFKLSVCFFAVNIGFAGIMFLMWYFFSPQNMYFNNGIVYFDISAIKLVIMTAVCYFLLKLISKILSFKVPSDTVMDLKVTVGEEEFNLRSFLDTGNNLKDPFSGYPVIIANCEKLKGIIPENVTDESIIKDGTVRIRFIVCSTVSGEGILPAFMPDTVKITGIRQSFETQKVIVAVTNRRLKNGDYDAILPSGLLSN